MNALEQPSSIQDSIHAAETAEDKESYRHVLSSQREESICVQEPLFNSPLSSLSHQDAETKFFGIKVKEDELSTIALESEDMVDQTSTSRTMKEKLMSSFHRTNNQNEGEESKSTPLPMASILTVVVVFLCEGFVYTFLFPFVGFMIMDFGMVKEESESGYYAGLLTGAFAIAEFFSGFVFAVLADRIPKKLLVLVSTLGCGVSILLFGLSPNYWTALVVRGVNGAFSGSVCVTKAYISDITDSTNQARAFALVTVGWGLGAMGGPAVGGFLSTPVSKYPKAFGKSRVFKRFPYLLPCLFASVLLFVGAVMVGLFMNQRKSNSCFKQKQEDNEEMKSMEVQEEGNNAGEEIASIDRHERNNNGEREADEPHEPIQPIDVPFRRRLITSVKSETKATIKLMYNFEVAATILLYGLYLVVEIFQDELLPLWSMIDTSKGGLGFSTIQIGFVQTILGFLYLVLPVVYEVLANRIGHLNCMRYGFAMMIGLMFTPQIALLNRNKAILWIAFTFYSFVRALSGTMTFTAAVLLVNNAAPLGSTGKVMAISNSSGCLARFIAPFVAGPALAISADLAHKFHFPLLLNIPFVMFSVISLVSILISLPLKPTLNVPKKEQEESLF